MPNKFCAQCIDEEEGLELEEFNGRMVQMCKDCREGRSMDANFSFGAGPRKMDTYARARGNSPKRSGK